MSRLAAAAGLAVVARAAVAAVTAVTALGLPARASAEPSTAPTPEIFVAGKLPLEDTLIVERVGPDGNAAEVFRGGAPSSWQWLDGHTLLELFDEHSTGEAVISWIVDGRPDPQHAIKLDNAAWPAEAQGWSQYMAVHRGQIWLVREPAASRPSGRPQRGKSARAKPARPVYQRVDVTPHVVQREPPAGGAAERTDGPAWFEGLPSLAPARGLVVTRSKLRIGRRNLGAVRCKPARGATTMYPTRATPPLLQVDLRSIRFVSPSLPLYVASGMVALPDGPRFATAAFLGCTQEPLHTLAWAGRDVFLTIAGAPGGRGFSEGDPRKMELWVDGRVVARLGVLLDPELAPLGAARAP